MKRAHKKIINILVFIGLAYFVTRPMYYPGVGDNPRPRRISVQFQPKDEIVSFKEMDDFLVLWSEFLEQDFASNNMIALLSTNAVANQKVSSRAQKWIKKQNWDVDRFFYVGRRLNSIVKACRLKLLAKKTRDSLRLQLDQTKNELVQNSIIRLMDEQSQMYKSENVSEGEIEMVMPHLDNVADILAGKLIYQPDNRK